MEFVDSSKSGQDQYVGFDVTLAKYLADYFGVKLEIVPMSFDACSTAVSSGTVNMSISGFSWKQDREDNFELSDTYHASDNEEAQVLLIRAADAEKYKDASDFDGLSVGAQNSSLQQALVTEQLSNAKLEIFGDIGVGVLELQSGNIEALAVADGNGTQIIANNPDLVKCSWSFDVKEEYEANVIMLQKGEDDLLEAVNAALKKAYDGGMYGPWYDEALQLADSASAREVSIEDDAGANG
jgi:polar amino acid transport system substrate-binding protein